MPEETNAAVQQPEPEKTAEQAVIKSETPPEPTETALPTEEPPADEAAASEPTAEKTDNSAAEIAELKGKVHALSVGANPDSLGDLLTLAAANVGESKTLEQAIDETLEKYPVFKNAAPPSITTSVDTKNDTQTEETDALIKMTNPFTSVEVADVRNKIGNLSYYGGSVRIRICRKLVHNSNQSCRNGAGGIQRCRRCLLPGLSQELSARS